MTPPEAPETQTGRPAPAVSSRLHTLTKRSDFLACARARRQVTPAFILQARDRKDGNTAIRVGFTASKKVGNAVTRNRAKRRMRALAREGLSLLGKPGFDYVLVARRDATTDLAYASLLDSLLSSLRQLHGPS